MKGRIDVSAKQKPIIGRYHTQAKPMTNKLIDTETDIVKDSIGIIPQRKVEFNIIVCNIFAKHVAATNSTNHPNPLKNVLL